MKRSEMIKNVTYEVLNEIPLNYFEGWTKDNFGSKIEFLTKFYLHQFEEAGMYPLKDAIFPLKDESENEDEE